MAKKALPLLLLGGAALLLMSRKKKGSGGTKQPVTLDLPPTPPPPSIKKTSGPSGGTASSDTWRQRQEALKFVAAMTKCSSDPGSVDGQYGPATKRAVKAFQGCAGIPQDGYWGPATEAAMKRILKDIAMGQVQIILDITKKVKEAGSGTSSNNKTTSDDGPVLEIKTENNRQTRVFCIDACRIWVAVGTPLNQDGQPIKYQGIETADMLNPNSVEPPTPGLYAIRELAAAAASAYRRGDASARLVSSGIAEQFN